MVLEVHPPAAARKNIDRKLHLYFTLSWSYVLLLNAGSVGTDARLRCIPPAIFLRVLFAVHGPFPGIYFASRLVPQHSNSSRNDAGFPS